jgi:hypothetical protein
MASKRQRGDREDEDGEDGAQSQVGLETMSILPIGAGNEVGRSCILLQYMGRKILLDCGIHPGYNGMAALPYFDEINPEEIDLLLVCANLACASCSTSSHLTRQQISDNSLSLRPCGISSIFY